MCNCSDNCNNCDPCGLCQTEEHVTECDACDAPCAVVEDKQCTVYIASNNAKRLDIGPDNFVEILQIDSSGTSSRYYANRISITPSTPFPNLDFPNGMVFDRLNNLYVVDASRSMITKIKPDKTIEGLQFDTNDEFDLVRHIEIEVTDCSVIYVAKLRTGTIYKINCNGLECKIFYQSPDGNHNVSGLAYDNKNKRLFATTKNNKITIFEDDGTIQNTISVPGANIITALVINSKNELLALDVSSKIFKITFDEFDDPQVCVFSNKLLLVNTFFMDIDIYDNLFITQFDITDKILKVDASSFQTLIKVPKAFYTGVAIKKGPLS